jgi:FAD/FMN-containing dehydrogenase
VLGLEVVLPDGTILDSLSTLRKDNTGEFTTVLKPTSETHQLSGYDLKQLFIGAEGTLGVVTGVSILTPAAPQAINNVILALPTFSNVLPLFKLAQRHLSEILSAFEYIDRTAYELAVKHKQGKGLGDEEIEGAECFVLLETSGGNKEHDEEVRVLSADAESLINFFVPKKLNAFLETLLESDQPLITTGALSQSPAQSVSLWKLREGIPEAISKEGKTYKYDISIPIAAFKEVVDATKEQLQRKGLLHEDAVREVIGYGHVGDGELQCITTFSC